MKCIIYLLIIVYEGGERKKGKLGKKGEVWLEGLLDRIHEIIAALAFARMPDFAYWVDTTSRLAQWWIDNLWIY